MSSRLDRIIREVLTEGQSTLLEADMTRRLDMLVRQGLMPASQLPILKRGLERFNQGKVPAPNERNAVNTLLNAMMFIVLGDDTVFNRARTSVQQKRYQTEEFDDLEEKMTVDIDHSGEKDDAAKKHGITLKRTGSTTVNATGSRKNLKKYLTHHHGGDKKDAADVHKGVFKEEQIAMRMAIEEDKDWPRPFTKAERSEFMRPKEKTPDETKAIKDRMKAKNKSRPKGVQESEELEIVSEAYKTGHKSYTDAVNHALDHHKKGGLESSADDRAQHIGLDSKKPGEGKTTRVNLPAKDKNGKKHMVHMQVYNKGGSHPYELNTYSSTTRALQKEEADHWSKDKTFHPTNTYHKHSAQFLKDKKAGKVTDLGRLKKSAQTGNLANPLKQHAQSSEPHANSSAELKAMKKEEHQLDEYGAMRSDKSSHNTGGMRISNADAADARERAVKKSAEKRASLAGERAKQKSAEKRDKLSNIIKKNTIQKGPMKGYMTDETNQGEQKMEIDWSKNPFAQAKAMKEGAFKRMATADAEEQRLKDQKKAKRISAKKGEEEKETDPGLKEGVAKNTLDIYQAHADKKKKDSLKVGQKAPAGASKANERQLSSIAKQMDKAVTRANAKLKEDLEGLPELDDMDLEMQENYQSPTKNNYSDKELRQAKGIAFDKRYKGGNMTGAAKAMEKIKKGLSDHPVASKALRKANEEHMKETYLEQFDGVESMNDVYEMSYKEKFQSMLKKTGKKLSDMSDEDKKKFFNKVDDNHDAVNENKAFRDAARDYAKDDKRGLAPTKQDAPKVSDAKNAKEIEHIVPQMRKAISVGKKVQFKDGKHHTFSKAHAAKFLNKYMSGKPADKEKMQSHAHASHKNFMDHAK